MDQIGLIILSIGISQGDKASFSLSGLPASLGKHKKTTDNAVVFVSILYNYKLT